jgi:three-Cys-motif partner protein
MAADSFFEEQSAQSRIKAEIVEKYFKVWAQVVGPTAKKFGSGRIAYVDLFSGPGRYSDGSKSVPIKVIELAASDDFLRNSLVSLFNDKDASSTASLNAEFQKIPGIANLKYPPQIYTSEIDAKEPLNILSNVAH